ncbi:MAG: hypothetical protein ACK4NA_08640 [Alphaproteobacteria bacterium]
MTAYPSRDAAKARDLFALRLLIAAFFLSGTGALIYQVIWQRMLGLFAGADSTSAALVVGAFLLGLGIGSLIASYFADRLTPRRAVGYYALCETAIALFALASPWFFHDFIVGELDGLAGDRLLVFFVCFLGLLIPTFLMGMSTPLVARAVVVTLEGAASRIGWLYGANTFGAGAGAVLGGWWLAGTLGFEGALWIGAGLNFAAVALAVLVLRRASGAVTAAPARQAAAVLADARDSAGAFGFPTWCVLMFLSGFFIIALEILWIRVLGVMWQQTAYSFSFILGIFLIADGAGMAAGAAITRRIRDSRPAFFAIQAFAALHAALAFLAIYALYDWQPFVAIMQPDLLRFRGAGLELSMLLTLFVVAPPAFLLGMSFPFVQHAVQRDLARVGQRVGLVQLANILGNAAGSIAAGLLLLDLLGSMGTLKTATILAALLLLAWAWLRARGEGGLRFAATPAAYGAALLALAAVAPSNAEFWSRVHRQQGETAGHVAEDRSGLAYMRVEPTADGSERGRMFIGGFSQSHVPFLQIHLFLGAIGPLVHPDPQDVMVIGVGSGGTPYAAGVNPATEAVTAIELVRPVYEVLRDYIATRADSIVARLFSDPRYKLVAGDGRHEIFVKHGRYDVIQSDAIMPETSNSGVLYSREFFELVRGALKPGGYYVLWAPTERTVDTFAQVFPYVVHLRPVSVLIGSDAPISFDAAALAARFDEPAIRAYLADAGADFGRLRAKFAEAPRVWSQADARDGGETNTDLFPRDEYYLNNRLRGAL